jgi:hypothetical protein
MTRMRLAVSVIIAVMAVLVIHGAGTISASVAVGSQMVDKKSTDPPGVIASCSWH